MKLVLRLSFKIAPGFATTLGHTLCKSSEDTGYLSLLIQNPSIAGTVA